MSKKEKPETIAHVVAGTCPLQKFTIAEWLEWRKREDERMARELAEQVAAYWALRNGATRH